MNVLSLFDGMSCGQIALNKADIKYGKYYASEVDKFAIKVTQKNYPQTIQLGDITQIKGSDLPKIDLLIGGSPCQGFSFAGKRLNFDDERSRLFFEYVRLLDETKPKFFLLENVKMKKEYQDVISGYLGVEPVFINSRLFSAQNRPRLYWTNIEVDSLSKIDSPLLIKDILEENVSNLFDISYKMRERVDRKKFSMACRVHSLTDKCSTLRGAIGGGNIPIINDNGRYRYLIPVEWERLQNVPDNYTDCVSRTQRYRMLGNGWTVNVIVHIFKNLRKEMND